MPQAAKSEPLIISSSEEMKLQGKLLGKQLGPRSVVALSGELGSGKTTFVKGLAESLSGLAESEINSPTFTYLNIYKGLLYHFDLYRVRSKEHFVSMGFEEYLYQGGICCIEWPEKILSLLPKDTIHVQLCYKNEGSRLMRISGRT